ncbi:MAG: aldolase [Alphaproteobacteria bacterium]|nr:aldolase [Alphaproteobacteria bacterium]
MQKILATSVKLGKKAVLIQGRPGVGKSFLALRLVMNHNARLISDDVTLLHSKGKQVYAEVIPEIAGKVEVRGVGILKLPYTTHVPVACVVQLVSNKIERMPHYKIITLAGIQIPLFTFNPNFVYNDLQVVAAVRFLQQKDGVC